MEKFINETLKTIVNCKRSSGHLDKEEVRAGIYKIFNDIVNKNNNKSKK